MRNVLFLAYNFPPAGGAGVQRSLKFVKYLPLYGWSSVIITATPAAYPVRDNSLWADVPEGTPVYRSRSWDINGLRPTLSRFRLGKLLSAFNLVLMLPDAALLWARLARGAVRKAIAQHQPRLVYSSSGPASAHVLGLWIKQHYGLRWVADFRDPWSENRLLPYYPGYRAVNRRLEHRVLTTADRVITVSQPLARDLERLSGPNRPSISVIENGFDKQDIVPLPPQRTDRFTITYTGTLSRLRRPDAFVTAIDQLVESGQIPLHQLRVLIAGKDTCNYIPDRPPFEQTGYLSHQALGQVRSQTDLFLFLQDNLPESRGAYSAKLFEYLGANRPILAITHQDNVGAELVRRARAGTTTVYNPDAIASAVQQHYLSWKEQRFDHNPDWSIINQYTRRNLTARLAAEFDRLAGEPAR